MKIVSLILLCWAAPLCHAVIETYDFSSAALEARYRELSQELRCPKCQNQNIADSNAPISRDLRSLLHTQLEAGASDDEILAFMVQRYGEFVRYRPAVDENTAVLWFGPAVLALLGLIALGVHLRSRKNSVASSGLTEDERALLRNRLNERAASLNNKDES